MNIHLCFHGIGRCRAEREPGEARYWVGEHVFAGVLDVAAGDPRVRLSFDDGNVSDVEAALPALTERGLRADFFALAGRLDDPASVGPAELRELRAAGMTIGSHGWAHVPWRGLTSSALRREVDDARVALSEAVAAPVTTAALPLGRYDRASLSALARADYHAVYTSDRFPARPSAWLRARYSITASDTVESIRRLLQRRPGASEARNIAVSMIKRMR